MRWRLAAPMTAFGTGIWTPTLCISLPAGRAMLGYQESEIGDKPDEWFDRIHDADRERVKQEIAAHQKGEVPHFESEHRVLHKDGRFRWML